MIGRFFIQIKPAKPLEIHAIIDRFLKLSLAVDTVILPMTVLKRFDDALKPTKAAVVEMAKKLDEQKVEGQARDGILTTTAKQKFYNTSNFDFARLIADPDNVETNFEAYIQGFSSNVKDIIANFDFMSTVKIMEKGGVLFVTLQEFNSAKADMSPDKITSTDMGYIFEELIRKFSESYDEQAGAHFTSRDIIYLMTELLVSPEKAEIQENGCTKTAYDMAMGTSQMLGCLTERLGEISDEADLTCFGQEFNPETYAIAKADMLIKGGNATGMMYGDTLSDDKFSGYEFDYIISNPPFGIDWKREKTAVEAEAKRGFEGRFGAGLPAISDGQMLFMLNGVKKLKTGSGRMAIIQNGSSLFTGDAGSGASEIRRYVIENDLVDAVVQLPTDLFYNTGISTYIWILTKGKAMSRAGKVQLIDASGCFVKRRKNIGSKRVDLDERCIEMIVAAYDEFADKRYEDGEKTVESKVFENSFFGFSKVAVETAQADENGNPILKKGKPQPVKGQTDSEIVPLSEDIGEYMKKNVLPYNLLAFADESKSKTGYEIPFDSYQILKENDFVFKMIDLQNISTSRVGLSPYVGLVSPAYIRFTPKSEGQHCKFTYYFLMSMYYNCVFNSLGGDGVRSALNASDMGTFFIPWTNEKQQQKISAYLDRKCAQVDTLISNEEKQIERLKAYKQSIITEAVTKGLDPAAPMKDSGVEWIGEIPEKWEVVPIGTLFSIKKDIIGREPECVLSITQSGLKIKDTSVNEGQMAASYDKYQIVNIGDFAMNHMDLLTGWVDISVYEGVTSPDYRVFVLKHKQMIPDYFLKVFQMYYKNRIFYAFGQGVANMGRWRLPASNFVTIKISVPPIEEQRAIVAYLDQKCTQIDRLIALKQAKIEKLSQYKKSLIYEYVTGKKEVLQ